MSHMGTGAAPQGTAWTDPQCSAHPWHLSLQDSSERFEQPQNHSSAGGKGLLKSPGLLQVGGWSTASTSKGRVQLCLVLPKKA